MIRGLISNLFAVLGVGAIALLCGYMVGASGTPVVATALPLVFGLVTVVVGLLALWKKEDNSNVEQTAKRVASAKMLSGAAALVFAVCFGAGVLSGQAHKRQYAELDMNHLVGDKQPASYEGALQWFSLLSSLERYQASDEVKDFFYDALLQHEEEMRDAAKLTIDMQSALSLVLSRQVELEKRLTQLENDRREGNDSTTGDEGSSDTVGASNADEQGGGEPIVLTVTAAPQQKTIRTTLPDFCDPASPLRAPTRDLYLAIGVDFPCPDELGMELPAQPTPLPSPLPWPTVIPDGPWSPLDKRPSEDFLKGTDLGQIFEGIRGGAFTGSSELRVDELNPGLPSSE